MINVIAEGVGRRELCIEPVCGVSRVLDETIKHDRKLALSLFYATRLNVTLWRC